MTVKKVEFPKALSCLFDESKRYVIIYGGRGGLKSWSTAAALVLRAAKKPLRVLCAREIQRSLSESVHQLLKDQIIRLGLESAYTVLDSEIRGHNGSLFMFTGLRHQVSSIKSKEGIDILWVEEAESVSKNSWDTVVPTIRKEGSQIIVTFNPDIEESESYQRFVINPPTNSAVVKTTYRDNPWFPATLEQERLDLMKKDPTAYDNVWEGNPLAAIAGAIFAKELQKATEEGRITNVPHEKTKPVDMYLDLGRSDMTSIWFKQQVAYENRLLKYYENNGEHFSHYIMYMKNLPYAYGTIYLPHDAENELLSATKTIKQQVQDAFPSVRVVVVPRIAQKALAIDSARGMMGTCYWDKEGCADGLSHLRKYHYKTDPETGKVSKEPEHDVHSNAADAFMAIGQSTLPAAKPKQPQPHRQIIRRSGIIH